MRDARRSVACPRTSRVTREGLPLVTSMVQGELNRSAVAPVLQRTRVGQSLFYVRKKRFMRIQHVSGLDLISSFANVYLLQIQLSDID